MTEDDLARLLRSAPILWHMAEAGAWPSIRAHGLLSTSALLDRFGVAGEAREALEARRRTRSTAVPGSGGAATIRDNKPLAETALAGLLDDGMTPAEWYRLLNGRVFFWLDPKRLRRLMAAYPDRAHDVIEADAGSLVAAHRHAILLCPINSGAIGRARMRRGRGTFSTIAAYDLAGRKGPLRERVAELVVEHGVRDIGRHVLRVVRMRGGEPEAVVWEREPPLGP